MKTLEQIKEKIENLELLVDFSDESQDNPNDEKIKGTIDALKWVISDEESAYEELNDYDGKFADGITVTTEAVDCF